MTILIGKALEVLLVFLGLAFSNCSKDRKRLHDIEWEAEECSPSILGEVEVRADTVIGIARSCINKQPDNIDGLIDILKEKSIYQSESIVNWLAVDGGDYLGFVGYIVAIENLRSGTVALLEQM